MYVENISNKPIGFGDESDILPGEVGLVPEYLENSAIINRFIALKLISEVPNPKGGLTSAESAGNSVPADAKETTVVDENATTETYEASLKTKKRPQLVKMCEEAGIEVLESDDAPSLKLKLASNHNK